MVDVTCFLPSKLRKDEKRLDKCIKAVNSIFLYIQTRNWRPRALRARHLHSFNHYQPHCIYLRKRTRSVRPLHSSILMEIYVDRLHSLKTSQLFAIIKASRHLHHFNHYKLHCTYCGIARFVRAHFVVCIFCFCYYYRQRTLCACTLHSSIH